MNEHHAGASIDLADFEEALQLGGFHIPSRTYRRTSFGAVFSYRHEDDDDRLAHVIYPPREWGAPHTHRAVIALDFHFADDEDCLIAGEHAFTAVYEVGDPTDTALMPLSPEGIELFKHLRQARGARTVFVTDDQENGW